MEGKQCSIEINMDKACVQCGQMGAAQGGICISCAADNIKNQATSGSGELTALACRRRTRRNEIIRSLPNGNMPLL